MRILRCFYVGIIALGNQVLGWWRGGCSETGDVMGIDRSMHACISMRWKDVKVEAVLCVRAEMGWWGRGWIGRGMA